MTVTLECNDSPEEVLPYCFLVICLSLVLAVAGLSVPSLSHPRCCNNFTHFDKEIRGRRQCNMEIIELVVGHPVRSTSCKIYSHGVAIQHEQTRSHLGS
jgi:hypothetical protein